MNQVRSYFIGLVIATFPIFSLYSISSISVSFIFMLICYIFIIRNKQYAFKSKYICDLKTLALVFIILSFNGIVTIGYHDLSLIFAIIMLLLSVIVFLPVMEASNQEITYKCFVIVGYISCAVAFYQLFATITGAPYIYGRIEFLELDSSVAAWMNDNYGFRINSIFCEPSYFAIYLLPIFTYSLKNNKYVNSIIFGLGIILSSSSMGILCLAGVTFYEMVLTKGVLKRDYKSLIVLSFMIVILTIFIQNNQDVISILERSSSKIESISEGGDESRLFGGRELFWTLPAKEAIFGVGLSQMSNYFKLQGLLIPNYANTPVTVLINSGIIGLIFLVIFYFKVFKISKKNGTEVFFFLFLVISCADPLVYNQRFYHLIFFVYFMIQRSSIDYTMATKKHK